MFESFKIFLSVSFSSACWGPFAKWFIHKFHGCALIKIVGKPMIWTCEFQGAQHTYDFKNDFLVAQEQT